MSSNTSSPSLRNDSAMRVAVSAARKRTSGGSSDVATMTTERARPSGPRSRAMNSCTSRPRSPTKASTETSASVPRIIIDIRLDLPTPEPANMPIRCPRPQGTSVSMTRTPSGSCSVTGRRRNGCGAAPVTVTRSSPAGSGRPSRGRPNPSRTRPRRARPVKIVGAPPRATAALPIRTPRRLPNGIQVAE